MKKYDSCLEVYIQTSTDEFLQVFESHWKIKEAIDWLKDTYCINDDSIIRIESRLITVFKYGKSS